ncbi:hypothetical protein [Aquiflexum sp.]|uniref:hypothetical protein n=1 Tax=Aquiflexum sp. TaxID=1872584 RepID=UPI00359356BE
MENKLKNSAIRNLTKIFKIQMYSLQYIKYEVTKSGLWISDIVTFRASHFPTSVIACLTAVMVIRHPTSSTSHLLTSILPYTLKNNQL